MNAKGYDIQGIYMSGRSRYRPDLHICLTKGRLLIMLPTGGQAANIKLMQLFADTCNIPVILPFSSGAAVVIGAAMLGRFAAEVVQQENKILETQADVEKASDVHRERLWNIMVRPLIMRLWRNTQELNLMSPLG